MRQLFLGAQASGRWYRTRRISAVSLAAALAFTTLTWSPTSAAPAGSEVWSTTMPQVVVREIAAVGPVVVTAGEFTDYRGEGVQATGSSRHTGDIAWTYRFGAGESASVAGLEGSTDGQRVYVRARVRSSDGVVRDVLTALDSATGLELWTVTEELARGWDASATLPTKSGVITLLTRTPRLKRTPNGNLEVRPTEGPDCRVRSLGAVGQQHWERLLTSSCEAADLSAAGALVLGGGIARPDGELWRLAVFSTSLRSSDGATRWRTRHMRQVRGTVADVAISPSGGTAAVSTQSVSDGAEVWAVNVDDGQEQWRVQARTQTRAALEWSVGGRRVFSYGFRPGGRSGLLVEALAAESGRTVWSNKELSVSGEIFDDATAIPGNLLLTGLRHFWVSVDGDGFLEQQMWVVALSAQDGTREWRAPFGGRSSNVRDEDVAVPRAGIAADPSDPEAVYVAGSWGWRGPDGFATAIGTEIGEPGSIRWQRAPLTQAQQVVATPGAVLTSGRAIEDGGTESVQTSGHDPSSGMRMWTHRFANGDTAAVSAMRTDADESIAYVRARNPVGGGVVADRVAAIDIDDGTELWQQSVRGERSWQPGELLPAGSRVVLVDTRRSRFHDPEEKNCRLMGIGESGVQWVHRLHLTHCSGDVSSSGRVFVVGVWPRERRGEVEYRLTTLRIAPHDGSVIWRGADTLRGKTREPSVMGVAVAPDDSALAVTFNRIAFDSVRGVALVHARGGRVAWQRPRTDSNGEDIEWAPNASALYLFGNLPATEKLHAESLKLRTGATRWDVRERTLMADGSNVAVTRDALYLAGTRVWRVPTPCGPNPPPEGCGTDVESQAWTVALSPANGVRLWRAPVGERSGNASDTVRLTAGVEADPARGLLYLAGRQSGRGYVAAVSTG